MKNNGVENQAPLISIVTPAYNAARYIPETIQSVQSQTWRRWEMLIVDDASQDGTWEIIRSASGKDPRIKIFRHETNQGVSRTRNSGLKKAQGRYIAFLDSDDLWFPAKLERQIFRMQEGGWAFCYTDYDHIDGDGNFLKKTNWVQEKFTYEELLCFNGIGSLTVVVDREKAGPLYFEDRGHEDYILWLDILKRGMTAHGIHEVLAHHRILPHSLSRNKVKTALWTWNIYRKSQRLSLPETFYYFSRWSLHKLKKYGPPGTMSGAAAEATQTRPLAVHVIDRLPPDGAERLVVDVLRNRTGEFDYIVLCLVAGGGLEAELLEIGVPVIILGKKGKFDLSLLFRLYRWFRSERPAVAHTHLFTADSWARLAAVMARVPGIFCTVHSENKWKKFPHKAVDRLLALFSNQVIACSEQVAEVLQRCNHINGRRIVTISNGIDFRRLQNAKAIDFASEFGITSHAVRLALVGRLHPAKGHLDLLPVMTRLKKEGVDFHLLFAGDGELRDEIQRTISALELERHVTLTGFRRDIPDILASIDILVIPSRWEGLPITLLEGMAMGKAVLGSSVGGIPDAIKDGYNGYLFEAGDQEALMEKLHRLMWDKELRERFGANAKAAVERKYSAAGVCRKYESLYREALGCHRAI